MDNEIYNTGKSIDFLRDLQSKIVMGQLSDDDKINAHQKLAVAISLIKDMGKDYRTLLATRMTHHEAINYLNEAKFGGNEDWRMVSECVGLVRGGPGTDAMSIGSAHRLAKHIMEQKYAANE